MAAKAPTPPDKAATADAPVQIEPLTAKEKKQRKNAPHEEDDPNYPEDWKEKGLAPIIRDCVDKGYKYYKRRQGDRMYMLLRKGKHDRGLGAWDEEKEGKLFAFYPELTTMGGIPKPPPWMNQGQTPQGRTYLSVPISRVAIIPRDFVPSINTIRYFQMVKEKGFAGDFSQFINDVIRHHMQDCHGVTLPYVFKSDEPLEIEPEMQVEGERGNVGQSTT